MNREQIDSDFDDGFDDDHFDQEDSDELDESIKFKNFVRVCPACRQPITDEMASCPYCGDILFRYLRDSTFAPRKGLPAKVFAATVILALILATLSMLVGLVF